jgi:hypothetical protein
MAAPVSCLRDCRTMGAARIPTLNVPAMVGICPDSRSAIGSAAERDRCPGPTGTGLRPQHHLPIVAGVPGP